MTEFRFSVTLLAALMRMNLLQVVEEMVIVSAVVAVTVTLPRLEQPLRVSVPPVLSV